MGRSRELPSSRYRGELLGLGAVPVEKGARHRTGPTAGHDAIVDPHDRHDLARRAREKRLVGSKQILVSEHLLTDRYAELAPDLEQEFSCNACEEAGRKRRGPDGAVLDDEDVGGPALGQFAPR